MLILVDARSQVIDAFVSQLAKEGIVVAGFDPLALFEWISTATKSEFAAVEGFLIGELADRPACARLLRSRSNSPIIALNDFAALEQTLDLFAAGVDDVVRKPVHAREIRARLRAIQRRSEPRPNDASVGAIRIYFDGRDPEVGGDVLPLPRRERRILELLAAHRGRRVTKSQIFNSIYGLFDENIEENVVESHVSKLRKKLRVRMGYDPIDSKRYLGYCLVDDMARRHKPARHDDCRIEGRQPPEAEARHARDLVCA